MELLRTGDLDPVYIALERAHLPEDQLQRWLLAYWCFYRADVASRLSEAEGSAFWLLMQHADQDRWPRGRERRHFRGRTSEHAIIAWLQAAFEDPEEAITHLVLESRPIGNAEPALAFTNFKDQIELWAGFGPWIAFKAADMLERLGLAEIRFGLEIFDWYEEPRAGAELARQHFALADAAAAVRKLKVTFDNAGFLAPPRLDRPVGIQEIETVLCKWKSHQHGHYPVGIDTRELREALEIGAGRSVGAPAAWGSQTAERMLQHVPTGVPWWEHTP